MKKEWFLLTDSGMQSRACWISKNFRILEALPEGTWELVCHPDIQTLICRQRERAHAIARD